MAGLVVELRGARGALLVEQQTSCRSFDFAEMIWKSRRVHEGSLAVVYLCSRTARARTIDP